MILGILLVLAGVLFLGGRYVPWLDIANVWPLIIVALGVVQAVRGRDVVGVLDGLTTVVIGGILFANATGLLSWGVWAGILALWPLLLVAAGIAIIGRAVSQTWVRAAAQLVIIGGLLYGALVMPATSWRIPLFRSSWNTGPMASFSESITPSSGEPTVTSGVAAVRWGGAEVNAVAGPGIAAMSGTAPKSAPPELTADIAGGKADVKVGREGVGGAGPEGRLDVTFGRDIRWESIVVAIGATSGRIDLSGLEVDRLELDTGASDTTVVIGDKSPRVDVAVNAGVANVVIRVPKDAAVTARVQGPATSRMPSGFRSVGGTLMDGRWEGGPADARVRIDVVFKGGIANFEIQAY